MLWKVRVARIFGVDHRAVRVVRAIDRRRLAVVALVTLLLSLRPLFGPALQSFSPVEIALSWFEHLVELAVMAAALTAVYSLLDAAVPQRGLLRLGAVCTVLFGSSVVLT